MNIRNRTALITGASRGLGRALALELAGRGAAVVLIARSRGPLDEVAHEIRAAGGTAHVIAADIADKRAIHRIAGEAAAVVGAIDILIHNASTLGPTPLRLLLDTDCEELQAVLETNVIGPFRLSKVIAGNMVLRDDGIIVHISSDAAVAAYPTWGAYSVSKAALDHLGRILAAELADTAVQIINVDPGEMDTQMHANAIPEADRAALANPADVAARIAELIVNRERVASGSRVEAAAWEVAS